jgi:hypothetical protein
MKGTEKKYWRKGEKSEGNEYAEITIPRDVLPSRVVDFYQFFREHTASIYRLRFTLAAGSDYTSDLKLEALLLCP